MVDPEELREEPEDPAEPEPQRDSREPPDYTMKKKETDAAKPRPTKKERRKGKPFEGLSPSAMPKPSRREGPSVHGAPPTPKPKRASTFEERKTPEPTKKTEPKLIVPPGSSRLGNVPTTLEGIMASDNQGKSTNEVLGILVEAHIQEADAILGRTRLTHEDLTTVTNALDLARHGIGGIFERPMPRVSEWVLSKLRALPSIDGKSRGEFVQAWRSAEERLRAEENAKTRRQEKFANA